MLPEIHNSQELPSSLAQSSTFLPAHIDIRSRSKGLNASMTRIREE